MEKNPSPKRLKANVVTTEKLGFRAITTKTVAADAITQNEAAFGTTVVSPTQPTEYLKEGFTWVNPDDGATNVYSTTLDDFVPVTDANAQLTADGKNTIYAQTTAPTGGTYKTNDIWFDTDDGNKLYTWNGSAWVSIQDTAITAAANAASAAQSSADGKNKIYRQTTEPTGGTYVAGDTWFDTDGDNAIYRYSLATTSTVSNKALTSNVATLTTSAAHSFTPGESVVVTGVDSTFNGTYTVVAVPTTTTFTYAKTATNVPSAASSGTITNSAGWKSILLGSSAITSISATQISTGTLAAGVVYAGSLNANQISTGTIASNIVYAGTVNATQINAGTLTAGVVYAGDIAASQITAGTISATITITSPTITGATITGGTIRTAASGTRIELTTSNSNRIDFWGSGTAQGAISVNDYRMFVYAPGSSFGAGAVLSLYGDQSPTTPNGVFITGGTSLALTLAMSSTTISLNQGTYGVRVTSAGVVVDGAATASGYYLRNARVTTSAQTSGAASDTTDGNIVLVREA